MPDLQYSLLTGLLMALTVGSGWALDLGTYEMISIPRGNYSAALDVDLASTKDFLGLLRVEMVLQVDMDTGLPLDGGRPSLFLSTKSEHKDLGIGSQDWERSLSYEWSLVSTGHVHISTCEDHDGKKRTPGIHSNQGYLSEETTSTMAYCLETDTQLQAKETSLSRLGLKGWSVNAPDKECRCADTSTAQPMLYVRAYCHPLGDDCKIKVRISAMCSQGKVKQANGKCVLCPESSKYSVVSEPEVKAVCLNETDTCAAGSWVNNVYCTADDVAALEAENSKLSPWELCAGKCDSKTTSAEPEVANADENNGGRCYTRCERCQQPAFSSAGDTSCTYTMDTCPAGTFARWQDQACVDCPYGKYSPEIGAASSLVCKSCGVGKYLPQTRGSDSSQCIGCGADTFNDLEAAQVCKDCPAGRLTLLKETAVEKQYRTAKGLPPPTPNATQGEDRKDGKSTCRELCKLGQHYTSNDECLSCMGGEDWCIGTDECLGNRTGDGCTRCLTGFYTGRGEICTPCPPDSIGSLIILIIIIAVLLGLLFVFTGSSRPEASMSSLTILIGHIQIQGYLIKLPINWPPEFIWFMKFLASIFTFDIPALVPAPECSFSFGVEQKYFFAMGTLPFIMAFVWTAPLITTIWYSLCRCHGCYCCRKRDRYSGNRCVAAERVITHKAIGVTTIMLSIMYGFLAPSSTQLGLCSRRPSEMHLSVAPTWMNEDPSVECFWYHYFAATIIGIVYVAGIPLFLGMFLLRGHKHRMLYDEEGWIPDYVGWIYLRFEHSLFWWELVNMITKTLIGITERVGSGPQINRFQCIHDVLIIQNERDLCGQECAEAANILLSVNASANGTLPERVIAASDDLCVQMEDMPPVPQLVITFLILSISLILHAWLRPYAPMDERGAIKTRMLKFTIMGSRHMHGVTFDVLPSARRGFVVHSANEDAKHRPESSDFKHHLHLGDVILSVNGFKLPHVYKRQRRRALAARLTSGFHKNKQEVSTVTDTEGKDMADQQTLAPVKPQQSKKSDVSKKKGRISTGIAEPRLDLATVYGYIEASGDNGCQIEVERELRFHGSEMADGRSILQIKRKCSPEDILSIVCCIASIMALIFGLVNPKSPQQAFSSVKDAKNAAERGELDTKSQQTQGAAGIVILVFLFIILIGTLLFALGLFLKSQWWKIKETCNKTCKRNKIVGDPDLKRTDRETTQKFLVAVQEAKAALAEEVLRKRKERLARKARKAKHVMRTTSLSSVGKPDKGKESTGTDGTGEIEVKDAGGGEDI